MRCLRLASVALCIPFCVAALAQEPSLQVSVTATPEYTATYGWTIVKQSSFTTATLSTGQILPVEYTVTLTRGPAVKSDFKASGQISVYNPAGVDAVLVSLLLEAPGIASGTLDCGGLFPVTLAAGATRICNWTIAFADGANRTATVEVGTVGAVAGGIATALIDFAGAPPTTEIDECSYVTDAANAAFSANSCGSFSASYLADVGPYAACGSYEVVNTAWLTTNDTAQTAASSQVLAVTVPCEVGCTLTPGYWKTHSIRGPAPYDDTWSMIGEDTAFFLSGATWYDQLWTAPAGNAYWQLAHAYAAASLNVKNGASFDAVASIAAHARALLERFTPAEVGGLGGGSAVRADFLNTAAALAAYNKGAVGPGRCDE